ncbi:hypothetical protein VFPPC_09124 [Pochonia chlamydosporia 170]|uniref:Carbohydrate-binding module family 18 protein n=1 Tax=Pochonia chlamydosporia 170 TaxID=1380566 RepID=A0A179FDR0_METCM|nr:hypothetical protein VFPPC_09124 [Pochonia chlamydosporia 170]OAQ63249.2 hypothetical protein VFPPC_09124 [Pochonia chlamydosporia 170]
MRLNSLLFASLAAAEIHLNYDRSVEGQLDEFEVVEMVIDRNGWPSKLGELKNPLEQRDTSDAVFGRAALSANGVLDVLNKDKRQSCDAGYWYSFGRCCPTSTRCCSYGYCLPSDSRCCPQGPCKTTQQCCGSDRCIPSGAECCNGGRFCEAGNHCYILPSKGNLPVCCTNSRCTAHVENGVTTYASSSTTTRTYTTTRTRYYYWTITWYYYYYYWTYSAVIEASVVTSSRTSTTSVLSVSTTAAAAASRYFDSVSSTLTFSTPAAATSLASLTGSTKTVGDGGPTVTDGPGGSENTGNGGNGGDSAPTTSASGTRRPEGGSGAARMWSGGDVLGTMFVALGLSTGLLAVVL